MWVVSRRESEGIQMSFQDSSHPHAKPVHNPGQCFPGPFSSFSYRARTFRMTYPPLNQMNERSNPAHHHCIRLRPSEIVDAELREQVRLPAARKVGM